MLILPSFFFSFLKKTKQLLCITNNRNFFNNIPLLDNLLLF